MVKRLAVLLLSFFSTLIYAETDVSILKADQPVVIKENPIAIKEEVLNEKLLPTDSSLQAVEYDKNKEPIAFGSESGTKTNDIADNTTMLPDLFNTKPSFSVQGRLIEKENMSKEGSDIEGAAVNFIFIR